MYPFKKIEKKWQKKWLENLSQPNAINNQKKFYCLSMFSYPSGDKLHIGHWYNYGPADTIARYKKLKGFNVFQPQGFDAFGLPAENYAIKNNIHPAISTKSNIETIIHILRKIIFEKAIFLSLVNPFLLYLLDTKSLINDLIFSNLGFKELEIDINVFCR